MDRDFPVITHGRPRVDLKGVEPGTHYATERKRVEAKARQEREFVTQQNQSVEGRPRSTSVSFKDGTIEIERDHTMGERPSAWRARPGTFEADAGAEDYGRKHKHPGGSWHEPKTGGNGLTAGPKTTPQQRTALDDHETTTRRTRTVIITHSQ